MRGFAPVLALAATLANACGGDGTLPTGASPVAAEVAIAYELPRAAEASSLETLGCAGQVRVYPSWWGFSQVTMARTEAGRWDLLFEDVPIGLQRVNVIGPEECGPGTLVVNGVALDAGASGQGFAFTLHPDGSVSR